MSIDDEEFADYPMTYSIDNAILMHRDAHFGGDFATMLDYYQKEGKGVCRDFDLSRIEELSRFEKQIGKDLAATMLSGAEAEKVASARNAYKTLRDVYKIKDPKNKHPLLIADLILTEDPEATKEIQAIVSEKGSIVPALIDLVRNEDFHDPLFPGYGLAPALAAKSLGLIGDKRAIIALFETIGEGDFFDENIILEALRAIGEPAKAFLLKVLHGHPINLDNEQAAIALVGFKSDPEVSTACLKILQEIDLAKNLALATYLVLTCEGLSSPKQRQEFLELGKKASTPKSLSQDIAAVAKSWKTD